MTSPIYFYCIKFVHLEAAGKTPINCSSGLKGTVSLSNSFLTLEMLVKSDANGA
jgi:hypothetical protein